MKLDRALRGLPFHTDTIRITVPYGYHTDYRSTRITIWITMRITVPRELRCGLPFHANYDADYRSIRIIVLFSSSENDVFMLRGVA